MPTSSIARSPGATVLQSGRDIVINAPPPSTAPTSQSKPEIVDAKVQKPKAARVETGQTQTMINSPGGIQAGGNVTVNSDRRLINSIVLQVSIETLTIASTVTDVRVDLGLGSALALFTADRNRFRFVTDFMIRDQQLTPTRRRLSFVYSPETPTELLGKPIELLASVNALAVNYADIFATKHFDTTVGDTKLTCSVTVNGIAVATISAGVQPPGALGAGQTNFAVAEAFLKIPEFYATAVSIEND
jgi:hypothetical protein